MKLSVSEFAVAIGIRRNATLDSHGQELTSNGLLLVNNISHSFSFSLSLSQHITTGLASFTHDRF
jgi:hypothetical protein